MTREQGTGNREQGTGNREQGTGNTGNREQGTGNREQVLGNFTFRYLCCFFSVHLPSYLVEAGNG
ncbi:MAG: hypothetical protein RLZZ86_3284 [Cyanobacteriota bacterium]